MVVSDFDGGVPVKFFEAIAEIVLVAVPAALRNFQNAQPGADQHIVRGFHPALGEQRNEVFLLCFLYFLPVIV